MTIRWSFSLLHNLLTGIPCELFNCLRSSWIHDWGFEVLFEVVTCNIWVSEVVGGLIRWRKGCSDVSQVQTTARGCTVRQGWFGWQRVRLEVYCAQGFWLGSIGFVQSKRNCNWGWDIESPKWKKIKKIERNRCHSSNQWISHTILTKQCYQRGKLVHQVQASKKICQSNKGLDTPGTLVSQSKK